MEGFILYFIKSIAIHILTARYYTAHT